MIYTDEFAFIHIPKTSGTSIKKSIKLNYPNAKYMPEDMFSTDHNSDWRRVMHYPYSYWEPLVENKWVFSVVRNPFVRAISFYVFLKNLYAFKDTITNLTFEDIYTKSEEEFRLSTTTQTQFLTGNTSMVPNIFKYENGHNDIEDKLGFKISHKEMINPSYNYLDYYDEKREKLILDLFEEDFENFGYSSSLG